jgi:hypothetical protein
MNSVAALMTSHCRHRSEADVARFVAAISAESFSDGKVACAARECEQYPNPPFSAPQLVRVLQCYTFSNDAAKVLGLFLGPQIVYPMTCQEVNGILALFSMSNDKIAILPSLKPFILDGNNKLDIISGFTFSSDKEESEKILRDVKVQFMPKVP